MNDQSITCPNCQHSIPLSKALLEQATKKVQQQANEQLTQQLARQKQELQESMRQQLQKAVAEKQQEIVQASKASQENQAKKLQELQEELAQKAQRLAQAEQQEVILRKKTRELAEKEQTLALELERKLDSEREKIAQAVKKQESELHGLKLQEKDKQLELMRKQIEELRLRSEQGSMQIQGEVQEDQLKESLTMTFPTDEVTDVPTGVKGADLLQRVGARMGTNIGTIIWESKNTKKFSDSWISKLKHDQGLVHADAAVLVTQALPQTISGFGLQNGIWVTSYEHAIPLAVVLRSHLADLHAVTASMEGRDEKMHILHQYLSGSQFKNRIESIVLAFVAMKADLESEKRALSRIWSKREKEIEKVVLNTSGMYGDLQGIVGATLPTIQQLELEDGLEE